MIYVNVYEDREGAENIGLAGVEFKFTDPRTAFDMIEQFIAQGKYITINASEFVETCITPKEER